MTLRAGLALGFALVGTGLAEWGERKPSPSFRS